jgi:hypothetical protein
MVKFKTNATALDMAIVNSIKNVAVKNIELKNITFECETITDAVGHVFVRQRSVDRPIKWDELKNDEGDL